ncbi:MAG TPA: hypothetical protein PKC18_02755, partial [Lacipirellulaceae bacterium]|nr:hypothetical protein [Lacipirellulaceae bacterium]
MIVQAGDQTSQMRTGRRGGTMLAAALLSLARLNVMRRSLLLLAVGSIAIAPVRAETGPVDRRAVVARHDVVHRSAAPEHFLQVGNGEFAFAFDVTGLQTLDRSFERPIPLHTMSNWGWNSRPNSSSLKYEDSLTEYRVGDRVTTYADRQDSPAGEYFRANPHRFNLARIGLWWDGQGQRDAPLLEDFSQFDQSLDLWAGVATSRFALRGQSVTVTTVAHPARDIVAFRLESPAQASGALGVVLRFSSPLAAWGPAIDDFSRPDAHATSWRPDGPHGVTVERRLDDASYILRIHGGGGVEFTETAPHTLRVTWAERNAVDLTCEFLSPGSPHLRSSSAAFAEVISAAREHWRQFWTSGGAVDLGGVADARAREIERRVVLSQYLTAIHNGSLPPQESGFVCNSWFGKVHLEMHWWHAAHFALWGRPEILARSLGWYEQILPVAKDIARRQGYSGVRWPKMTGPAGISSPSGVGEFLLWQQPHLIYFAELLYRAEPSQKTLTQCAVLVESTAEFMADVVQWDHDGQTCHLGPPLI